MELSNLHDSVNNAHSNSYLPNTPTPKSNGGSSGLGPSPRASSHRIPDSTIAVDNGSEEYLPGQISMEDQEKTVNRRLRGIHVFMITISGVLGVGLYVRSGSILRIGGPAAVLISLTVMGLLAWMVMQCIGEMLALWPIANALVEFVGTFVDDDLGTAVGIAYWFTYSINFAALIVAAAGQIEIWTDAKAIQGTIMFFLVPLFLVLFNSFGVQIYGLTEVIGGSLKLLGVFIVVVSMIVINVHGDAYGSLGTKYYTEDSIFKYDPEVARNWASAFFICLSIGAFAYIGVEITAATALEASLDRPRRSDDNSETRAKKGPWPSVSVRFSATWTSFIAWIVYFLAGLLMTLNVRWDDPDLPSKGVVLSSPSNKTEKSDSLNTDSGFVISAARSRVPNLESVFTVLMLITALTAANTNLYVASRTLFGMTRKLRGRQWRWLAFFGRTNNYQVPVRAMFISCFFLWVPFLYLSPHNSPDTTIPSLLEVLTQLGSVGCLIVWASECWAFIRFYNCVKMHQNDLRNDEQCQHVCRFRRAGVEDRYPWRSHGQPLTMYMAVVGCLFVLIVANGASLWKVFQARAFLSAYLAPICFLPLWLFIKIYRSGGWRNIRWELEDLTIFAEVKEKFRRLDEIRQQATAPDETEQKPGWGNLWGLM